MSKRWFPIRRATCPMCNVTWLWPVIPWGLLEGNDHRLREEFGKTLEELADAGGLEAHEAVAIIEDRGIHPMHVCEAMELLGMPRRDDAPREGGEPMFRAGATPRGWSARVGWQRPAEVSSVRKWALHGFKPHTMECAGTEVKSWGVRILGLWVVFSHRFERAKAGRVEPVEPWPEPPYGATSNELIAEVVRRLEYLDTPGAIHLPPVPPSPRFIREDEDAEQAARRHEREHSNGGDNTVITRECLDRALAEFEEKLMRRGMMFQKREMENHARLEAAMREPHIVRGGRR